MRQLFKVPYPSNKGRALFYAELSLFVMLSHAKWPYINFDGGWTIGVASLGLNWVWKYNYVQIQVTCTNIETIPITDTVTAWPLPLAVEKHKRGLGKWTYGNNLNNQNERGLRCRCVSSPRMYFFFYTSHFLLLTNSNIFSDSDIQLVYGYAAKHSLTNVQVNL